MKRREFLTSALAISALWPSAQVIAQTPSRTGRLVWPYPAGGSADALARIVVQAISARSGQSFVVENRAGAGGRTGTASVVQAEPDGQTLLLATVALMSIFPIIYPKLNYDPFRQFTSLSQIARFDIALVVGPEIPARTISELLDWIRKNPAKASYSSPAAGSLPHFFVTALAQKAKLDLQYVPYAGAPPALNDVMSGHLPFMTLATADALGLHTSGKIKVLATSGSERSIVLPDVPTFREQGFDIEGYGWYAIYGPAGMSDETRNRWSELIQEIVKSEDVGNQIRKLGIEPTGTTSAELAVLQKYDFEKWTPIVKSSGFTPAQ